MRLLLLLALVGGGSRRRGRRAAAAAGAVKTVETIDDLGELFHLDLEPPRGREGASADEEPIVEVGEFARAALGPLTPHQGELLGRLVERTYGGLEARRSEALRQQGIYSTRRDAQFKTPLGLPCNPQKNPLLCGNASDITDASKPAEELRQERRQRKQERTQVRDMNNAYAQLTEPPPRRRRGRADETVAATASQLDS